MREYEFSLIRVLPYKDRKRDRVISSTPLFVFYKNNRSGYMLVSTYVGNKWKQNVCKKVCKVCRNADY